MELRKHYFLNKYVIIADERGKRPDQFKKEATVSDNKNCFFCPGNEEKTPPEILRIPKEEKNWKMRIIPNKFPFLRPEGNHELKTDNEYYTYANPYGNHELLIETPDHEKGVADLSIEELKELFNLYKERTLEHLKDEKIKYVQVFKNWGEWGGASLVHSHTQIAAYNLVPENVKEKEAATEKLGKCPYCEIIEKERNSDRRCYENNSAIAFTPYGSRFEMELWIMPKKHKINWLDFNDSEIEDMCKLLKEALLKLKRINASYNYYIHYGVKDMHFHIELIPRVTKWAGFEHATGTIVNIIPPERAAEFYRGEHDE